MHWMLYIALIWAAIYFTAIFIAFLVKVLLPIPPMVAALSGLLGGLIGVFYLIFKYTDHPVREMIDGIGRPEGPRPGIGDVVGEEDFGGIIDELREQDHGGTDDAEDRPADSTRQ